MKKAKVYLEKSVVFHKEMIIGVPDDMIDGVLDEILKDLQDSADDSGSNEVYEKLREAQIEIIEPMNEEDGEPDCILYEVTCFDMRDVKG